MNTEAFMFLICCWAVKLSAEFMNDILRDFIGDRKVNLKIGVYIARTRSKNLFWIEFDPQIELTLSKNQLLLPYVVVSDANQTRSQFIINEQFPYCSSIYPPSRFYKSIDELASQFNESCSKALLPQDREEFFSAMIAPSFDCGYGSKTHRSQAFPSIALLTVISELDRNIHLLDIDAQGGDTEVAAQM